MGVTIFTRTKQSGKAIPSAKSSIFHSHYFLPFCRLFCQCHNLFPSHSIFSYFPFLRICPQGNGFSESNNLPRSQLAASNHQFNHFRSTSIFPLNNKTFLLHWAKQLLEQSILHFEVTRHLSYKSKICYQVSAQVLFFRNQN